MLLKARRFLDRIAQRRKWVLSIVLLVTRQRLLLLLRLRLLMLYLGLLHLRLLLWHMASSWVSSGRSKGAKEVGRRCACGGNYLSRSAYVAHHAWYARVVVRAGSSLR
jgi:hypothetical protein